jgi:predicted transcriptional regulator
MGGDATYDKRDTTGRYAAKYNEQDILTAVRANEPAGTTEVADEVGFARQNADYRLRQLEKEGKVRSKKVGPALVWMLDGRGVTA